jgi:hypothetical protein
MVLFEPHCEKGSWPDQRTMDATRSISCQSPRTVETWFVVMLNGWLVLCCPRLGGQAGPARVSCLRGRGGSGVKGAPKVRRV